MPETANPAGWGGALNCQRGSDGSEHNVGQAQPATTYMRGRGKRLRALAEAINVEHRAALGHARKAIEHAAECGQRLIQTKALVRHGGWLGWLEKHTEVGARQSQNYMRLTEGWAEIEARSEPGSHLSINRALQLISDPKDERAENETAASDPRAAWAATIGQSWDKMRASLRGLARTAVEMRTALKDDATFTAALMVHAGMGKAFAEIAPRLLDGEADEAEWVEAFLADGEALVDSYTPPEGALFHGDEAELAALQSELGVLAAEVEAAGKDRLPEIIARVQEIQERTYAIRRSAAEAAQRLARLAGIGEVTR